MVVGKIAIHLRKQLQHLTAQRTENAWRCSTRHTVAAIHHNFYRARQFDITHNAGHIVRMHIGTAHTATGLQLPAFIFDGLAQRLNLRPIDGTTRQHHLETVVILGIVATGDHDAAAAQRRSGEIQHRRGAHAHVNHINPHIHQPRNQRLTQYWP